MSNFVDIKRAVNAIEKENNKKISILHRITDYPSKIEDANLNVLKTLKKNSNIKLDYQIIQIMT